MDCPVRDDNGPGHRRGHRRLILSKQAYKEEVEPADPCATTAPATRQHPDGRLLVSRTVAPGR
jgi:hypothetical protein